MAGDTGSGSSLNLNGEYQAYTDSLQGMLKFMGDKPSAVSSLRQLQSPQAKMQNADEIKEYIRQRKQQISQYIQQHTNLSHLLGKDYQGLSHDVYYYSQQVRSYQEMLNDPDRLTKEALTIHNKLPAFQAFMQQNSTLAGLQTRDQVATQINQQVAGK